MLFWSLNVLVRIESLSFRVIHILSLKILMDILNVLEILRISLLIVFLKIASIFILNQVLSLDDILIVNILIIDKGAFSMDTRHLSSLILHHLLSLTLLGKIDGITRRWYTILSTCAISISSKERAMLVVILIL